MSERGRYRTKQQEIILNCLKKQALHFLTAEQFMDCLREEDVRVGQTTLYRMLERLAEDGEVMKLPAEDGSRIRYCYADKEKLDKAGKLVCLHCGSFIPLECSWLEGFMEHIYKEHGFELDKQHMILYGCCERCKKKGQRVD